MIRSSLFVLLCTLALTSRHGTGVGVADAWLLDGANETLADLMTIEPIECGQALTDLGNIWLTDRDCIRDFDAVADFFVGLEFPSLSIDVDERRVELDRGALPDVPDIDFQGMCADGACIAQVADLHATIDEACKPDSLAKIGVEAANVIRATRAFADVVCVTNDDGEYCLDEFISGLRDYNPMSEDSGPGPRSALCSDCSKQIQSGLFGSLAPEYAYNVARMFCLEEEGDEDGGGFCPVGDLLMGASRSRGFLAPVWRQVYQDEDICASSCAAEALVLSGGEPIEECFEDAEEESILSYSFSFIGQKTGLTQDDVTEVVGALREDVGNAAGIFQDYVDVAFEEGGNFVVGLEKRFTDTFAGSGRRKLLADSLGELKEAVEASPLIETNKVADRVTEDPTRTLEVKGSFDPDTMSVGSRRSSSVAAVMIVAAAIGFIAL